VLTRAETCHIGYCYTPIRYAWEMPHQYLAEAGPVRAALLRPVMHRLRLWDYAAAQRVDRFIAISECVRRRIEKHYRRQAEVIYPPVEVDRFVPDDPDAGREDFYLVVSRLVGYKRVDLAAAAFTELGLPLRIVGTGPDEERVRRAAGPNVELLGWRSDDEVRDLYRRARALVFPGLEDFGLTPVEAQASGCPVIALGQGGAAETVVDGETGIHFAEPTVTDVKGAVARFGSTRIDSRRCIDNARRFDAARFAERLAAFVAQAHAEHRDQLRHGAR
jgi:glycosyltransferase involved in cell wall biosynthesis